MDLKRLQELEKLSGLELDPDERSGFLADLCALVEFVASLPDAPDFADVIDDEGCDHD